MSATRPAALLLLATLLLTGRAAADPRDSLTGADLLAERRARRLRVADEIGEGTLVLLAAEEAPLKDYRQDSGFLYLTGITTPGGALVLRVTRPEATERARAAQRLLDRMHALKQELLALALRARNERELSEEASALSRRLDPAIRSAEAIVREGRGRAEVVERLYLPLEDGRRARWVGERLSAGLEAARRTGIAECRDVRKLHDDLRADLPEGESLYRVPGSLQDFLQRRPDLLVHSAHRALARVRAVKSAEEVARIRRACELTCAGLREAMRSCRPGMREYELQAVLEYACRRGGAPRQAFPSIVGSGPNSTVLHYHANRRRIEAGDLVLMDVGGEYMGYAADVTRTFPANGRFSGRQAAIYDVVLAAQAAAIAAVRPGATFADVDRAARSVIAKAGHGHAFVHAASHYVGLDVHDPGPGGPLRPGMVLTVEPGIYLADEGLGVRIEDTVLVSEDGAEVLSPGAPKARREIEALMRKKGIGNLPIR